MTECDRSRHIIAPLFAALGRLAFVGADLQISWANIVGADLQISWADIVGADLQISWADIVGADL